MSGTTDRNWRSFVGPQDNNLTVTSWENPGARGDFDDNLKASNVVGLTVRDIVVLDSREDSIDCVRGKNYLFENVFSHGSITCKGAVDGFVLARCTISGTVELGQFDNYWVPGRLPTRNVSLINCKSPDGKPIRVKLWDAAAVNVVNSNVEITRIPKLVWYPYFLFRYLQTKFKNA
jgi:hypothetical protein